MTYIPPPVPSMPLPEPLPPGYTEAQWSAWYYRTKTWLDLQTYLLNHRRYYDDEQERIAQQKRHEDHMALGQRQVTLAGSGYPERAYVESRLIGLPTLVDPAAAVAQVRAEWKAVAAAFPPPPPIIIFPK